MQLNFLTVKNIPLLADLACKSRALWAIILGIVLTALSTGAYAQYSAIEDKDWLTPNPLAQRVDPAKLAAMTQHLLSQHPMVRSLLMVRNGQPVYEYYRADTQADSLHNVYSVTKSVVSLLVGRAVDQGLIRGMQEKLIDLLPAKPGPASNIRLDHLLTMSAGFDPGGISRDADYLNFMGRFYAPGLQAHALARPALAPSGERFYYNNTDAHLASLILAARVGMPVAAYADAQLFKPLGITRYMWDADSSGTNNGASELRLRPRDMAKIGQLVLQGGQWRGQQIISSSYMQTATQRQIDTNTVVGDMPSPMGYGYLWWTATTRDDQLSAQLAIGFGGQYIYIVPALQLVVVATTQASSRAMAAQTASVIRDFAVPAVQR